MNHNEIHKTVSNSARITLICYMMLALSQGSFAPIHYIGTRLLNKLTLHTSLYLLKQNAKLHSKHYTTDLFLFV